MSEDKWSYCGMKTCYLFFDGLYYVFELVYVYFDSAVQIVWAGCTVPGSKIDSEIYSTYSDANWYLMEMVEDGLNIFHFG